MAVTDLVKAANGSVPANELKPHNCHEAVIGWLIMSGNIEMVNVVNGSHNVEQAWKVLREIADKHGEGDVKQLSGKWVAENVYKNSRKINGGNSDEFEVGDVVSMGNPRAPHHSMVVVDKNGGQVLARGFNNAGAFGGPYMGWDATLRDLVAADRWDNGTFKCNNGPADIFVVRYNQIVQNIPTSNT